MVINFVPKFVYCKRYKWNLQFFWLLKENNEDEDENNKDDNENINQHDNEINQDYNANINAGEADRSTALLIVGFMVYLNQF